MFSKQIQEHWLFREFMCKPYHFTVFHHKKNLFFLIDWRVMFPENVRNSFKPRYCNLPEGVYWERTFDGDLANDIEQFATSSVSWLEDHKMMNELHFNINNANVLSESMTRLDSTYFETLTIDQSSNMSTRSQSWQKPASESFLMYCCQTWSMLYDGYSAT